MCSFSCIVIESQTVCLLFSCCKTTYQWVKINLTRAVLGLSFVIELIYFLYSFNRDAQDQSLKCSRCHPETHLKALGSVGEDSGFVPILSVRLDWDGWWTHTFKAFPAVWVGPVRASVWLLKARVDPTPVDSGCAFGVIVERNHRPQRDVDPIKLLKVWSWRGVASKHDA